MWPGFLKNVPGFVYSAVCDLSDPKVVVIHLLHWFFMNNRTYEDKLKEYEVRTPLTK